MPRKVKTEKPPLQFLERSVCGARVQNAPEVRAAVNPKDFFTDGQEQDKTALRSWVGVSIHLNAVILATYVARHVLNFRSARSFRPQLLPLPQ